MHARAGVAFFDERDAANGVEGASLIFQLYTIASSGVSFLKHQRHFAHREATTVSARSSAPSRPLWDYARLIEGNAPITARFEFLNYPRNTRKRVGRVSIVEQITRRVYGRQLFAPDAVTLNY